jgi:hypothetical protein
MWIRVNTMKNKRDENYSEKITHTVATFPRHNRNITGKSYSDKINVNTKTPYI